MFVTLTQLQKGEASVLQTVIDNTCGKLNVALRGFHYEVGYRNVSSSSGILWRPDVDVTDDSPNNRPQKIPVPAGLYTIERLSHFVMEEIPGLTLNMNKATDGLIKLNIPESSGMIKLTGDLRRILGIDERGWIDGQYEGDKPAKFIAHRWFHIYLDQLSTTSNLVDGAPSTLLATVPVAAGGVVDINPHYPMYNKLEVGHIHQLNLRVLDENGTIVQNRERPITAVLEIRENAQAANGAASREDGSGVDIS